MDPELKDERLVLFDALRDVFLLALIIGRQIELELLLCLVEDVVLPLLLRRLRCRLLLRVLMELLCVAISLLELVEIRW